MKQLIVSILLITALIAIFVIVDYRIINRKDTVQTVRDEHFSPNGKLSVFDSENTPVTPVADQSATVAGDISDILICSEIKRGGVSLGAKRSPGAFPVKTNPAGKPVPAAVPVMSQEEAERLNEEAKEYASAEKERKEPFFKLYQNNKINTFCFEGTIRATSTIPDPAKNDYDNCLYALFVELDSFLSEDSTKTKIPYEAIVNTPIMKNKTILHDNRFLPGDKVRCICANYDAMPQAIQEIQLSDDIQSYEHQQYYSLEIKKISAFQKGGNRNFAKREITVLPLQTLPREEKATIARKERIQSEIKRIENEIKKHGGSFEAWKEEYKPIIEKYKKLSSEKYKLWIGDSYFACGIGEPIYKTQEYIKGIQPYKKYLEDNNIDLIIVRIPNKWEFARCVLTSDVFQENPAWLEHYYECLKNDIEIIDPMPEMWKHRFDFPLFYYYNVYSESHPFEGQAFVSANVLSDVLKRYSYSLSETAFELEYCVLKNNLPVNFWPEGNSNFNPEENIKVKRVIQNGKTVGGLAVNTGSPFLFLSNSFFARPSRVQGASVPAYTAYFLKHVPDWFYQTGIGNPMIRNLISNPQALSNRKAVIMVGHPKYWNNSFPTFPKYLTDNARRISLEKTIGFQSADVMNHDNGSFVFEKSEDGAISFTQNKNKKNPNNFLDVQISIPSVKDKGTCMLRVNFGINFYVTTIISDYNTKDIIDQTELSPGNNLHTDFYIPIADKTRQISIRFVFLYPDRQFSIKNFELWYY